MNKTQLMPKKNIKRLLLSTLIFCNCTSVFADKSTVVKDFIVQNDFVTWLDNGESLFNWQEITQTVPKIAVSTNRIKKDFEANEVSANRKYTNQWVRVKGTIKNVKLDKDGNMYADLTQNYINFKAYISNPDYAASLSPNQKVDMLCFNATPDLTNDCSDYHATIWNKALSSHALTKIKENKSISLFSSILSNSIPDNVFKTSCPNNLLSSTCENSISNQLDNIDKILEKEVKRYCAKSNTSDDCNDLKSAIGELENLLNQK